MKWNPQLGTMWLAPCAALLLCGCSSVSTKHPLTKEPQAIDQERFEGAWLMETTVLHVKFASNGIAQFVGLEWKDDDFQMFRGEMIVTKGDEHNFLSVRIQQDGQWTDRYFFVQYRFTDHGELVVCRLNNDVFEQALEQKVLQGVIDKQDYSTEIRITSEPEKLLEFINDPGNLTLFDYTEPMILRKIAGDNKTTHRP